MLLSERAAIVTRESRQRCQRRPTLLDTIRDNDPTCAQLHALAEEIERRLSERRWRVRRYGEPEYRRNMDRLYLALHDGCRLHRMGALNGSLGQELLCRLALEPEELDKLDGEALGERIEIVDEMLVTLGDDDFVQSALKSEISRSKEAVEGTPTLVTEFGEDALSAAQKFQCSKDDPEPLNDMKEMLRVVYRRRHQWYMLRRNRDLAKMRRLSLLGLALLLVVIATAVGIELATEERTWRDLLAAVSMGALGATFSAAVKLRNVPPRLERLRMFWSGWLCQVALGCVSGLFVFTLLKGEFIRLGVTGATWAVEATFAFVAGASEPVVFNTVERLAGIGEQGVESSEPNPGTSEG
jgi:hypothetical protein